MTTKELVEARINGAIAQLSGAVFTEEDYEDAAAPLAELNVDAARRILKALVKSALQIAANDLEGRLDQYMPSFHAVARLREIAEREL